MDPTFELKTLEGGQFLDCRICGAEVWHETISGVFRKMRNKPAYEAEIREAMRRHRMMCAVPGAAP